MREVDPQDWQSSHSELLNAGYVRFEYLTAAHNAENIFEIYSKVSTRDLSDSVLLKSQIDGAVESVISIYPNAKFHEQEAHQMFGIEFNSHEKIQDAFALKLEGFPMRRDFALKVRQQTTWPGAVEPDEKARRRPSLPPGVHESWAK